MGVDLYTGPIPITWSVKVVQANNVQFEDGSFAGIEQDQIVQIFSNDFNVLSIDGEDLTSLGPGKINTHLVKRNDGAVCSLGNALLMPVAIGSEAHLAGDVARRTLVHKSPLR